MGGGWKHQRKVISGGRGGIKGGGTNALKSKIILLYGRQNVSDTILLLPARFAQNFCLETFEKFVCKN